MNQAFRNPTPNQPVEHWLSQLGQARSAGMFEKPASLPWKTATVAAPIAKATGFRRTGWTIAAAACVGFALIGIWRLEAMLTATHTDSANSLSLAALPHKTQTTAPVRIADVTKPAMPPAKAALEGDYNGDGRVDGEDIQYFLNQQAHQSDSKVDNARDFARRLLGS